MGICVSGLSDKRSQNASKCDALPGHKPTKPVLDLLQFDLRRVIGKGAFGKVKVVVHKESGCTYALKYISKVLCIQRHAAPNVIRERKILELLHHPLVCNLRYAFQDAHYIYLVSDLMLGGDLRFHLLRKTFTESAIRHWIAEVASALAYCHSRGIIHRDVKPDNILLTAEGHCKLADFNISTQLRGKSMAQSRSGSFFYMAPEIHQGKYYDFAVDYWSLGVVFYEAIYGQRPFTGKCSSEVSDMVKESPVALLPYLPAVSDDCQEAIRSFLEKNPKYRCHTTADVASLSFFASMDWSVLDLGLSPPIFVPGEGKNFDAAWELEEILLQDVPLESRRLNSKKASVPENDAEAQMYRLIEDHFTDFSFEWMDASQDAAAMSSQHESEGFGTEALGIEDSDFVDTEERTPRAETNTMNATLDRTAIPPKHRSFKTKSKKSVILPPGVLSMKAGGRVKV